MQYDKDQIERDYEALVTAISGMGQHLLTKQNGFIPIAAAIDYNGVLSYISEDNGSENPSVREVFDFLRESLEAALHQDVYRAIAIAVDRLMQNPEFSGVIQIVVATKHELGKQIFIPYKKTNDGYVLGERLPS